MENKKREYETFTFETHDRVGVFDFKGKAFFNAGKLYDMEPIVSSFKECSDDPNLKVIVVKRVREKKDSKEYMEFIRHVAHSSDKLEIQKMLNFYNRFIAEVYSQDKFVLSVDSGNVVAQFLSISLACDYRIITDDTVIQKEYFHNGMVPKGGATFFLSQIVGKKKAYEILLSGDDITAAQALEMGLVDEVVPAAQLDEATMKTAMHYAGLPRQTLTGIKRLMNFTTVDLKKYLEYENHVIVEIFSRLKVD